MNNILEKVISNDIDTEVVFENIYEHENNDLKEALNSLLELMPSLKPTQLSALLNLMSEDAIAKVNKKDASIVFFSKILSIAAKYLGYQLYQQGKGFWIYNSKKWIEIDLQLLKDFLKTASNKIGISLFISSSVSFINKLEKQIIQDAYFEISIPKDITCINVNNGIVLISKNGVDFINHYPKYFLTHLLNINYDVSEVYDEFKWFNSIIPSRDTQKTLQHAIAQIFVKGFSNEKRICLHGLDYKKVSYFIESLEKVVPQDLVGAYFERNNVKLKDLFVDYQKIKQESNLLETLTIIPCHSSVANDMSSLNNQSALFHWLIDGVKDIIQSQHIYISKECEEFRNLFNIVGLFVDETSLVKTENNAKSIISSYENVFKQYESFCELKDEKALTKTMFNRELKALGFESTRRDTGNVWFAKFV